MVVRSFFGPGVGWIAVESSIACCAGSGRRSRWFPGGFDDDLSNQGHIVWPVVLAHRGNRKEIRLYCKCIALGDPGEARIRKHREVAIRLGARSLAACACRRIVRAPGSASGKRVTLSSSWRPVPRPSRARWKVRCGRPSRTGSNIWVMPTSRQSPITSLPNRQSFTTWPRSASNARPIARYGDEGLCQSGLNQRIIRSQ